MNQFTIDNCWQMEIRDRILKPFYKAHSLDGQFVFADKGRLANLLQKELAIDTILQTQNNGIIGIEEKIVRYPGYDYTDYTLELMSCTIMGRERRGWMYSSKCDILLYCFMQADNSMIIHKIPFVNLQNWFFLNDNYKKYPSTITKQINKTECKIIPIIDVWGGVDGCSGCHLSGI